MSPIEKAKAKCKVSWMLLVNNKSDWDKYPELRAIITTGQGAPILTFRDVLSEQSWSIANHIVETHNASLK